MTRRFRSILWKEWLSLQPFAVLLVVLFVFGLIMVQVTEYMDELPFWKELVEVAWFNSWLIFFLSLTASLGLLTRERDDGTLVYLDGLPIRRASLYCAKWLLAVGLVGGMMILWTGESLVYEWLSRESTSPATPWRHVGVHVILCVFLSAFFVSFLFPFTFLRLWSLLVLILVYSALTIAEAIRFPLIEWLNPFTLFQPPEKVEDPWILPLDHMIALGSLGAVCWLAGLSIYVTRDSIRGQSSFRESFWGKFLAVCGMIAFVIVFLVIAVVKSNQAVESGAVDPSMDTGLSAEEVRPPEPEDRQVKTRLTGKFDFRYRAGIETKLQPLMDGADDIFVQVADFLRADHDAAVGSRVTVDLTQALGSHNAGQAHWKKIRMGWAPDLQLAEARAILGHELTHVFIDQLTGGNLESSFASSRWFHEGLAGYVEFRFFRKPEESADYDHWLALASTWGEVQFPELVDDAVLSAKRDTNIVYPAGLEWIRAGVDVYGDEFPARILSALGREDAPAKLGGMEKWRDACLAAGFDLERVYARFRVRLKDLRDKYREACAKMPEITAGKASRLDGKIVITPELPEKWKENAPPGASMICRLRPETSAPPGKWGYSELKSDGTFVVPALYFLKPRLGFQIGWMDKDWSKQPVFGEWIETTVE